MKYFLLSMNPSLVINPFTQVEFSPSSGWLTVESDEQCSLRLGGSWMVCT
jgi:hypothetical protein